MLGASVNVGQNVGTVQKLPSLKKWKAKTEQFAQTFSPPIADGTKALKIMIDLISLGYGMAAARSWNTFLKDSFLDKENKLDSDKQCVTWQPPSPQE
jgi:hypothetical protein